MKKRKPVNTLGKAMDILELTERFGVFEFATERQLVLMRTVLELMPKKEREKRRENFFAECAELGAWLLLTGANCAAGRKRIAAAGARAKKAIEREYKPSRQPKGKSHGNHSRSDVRRARVRKDHRQRVSGRH